MYLLGCDQHSYNPPCYNFACHSICLQPIPAERPEKHPNMERWQIAANHMTFPMLEYKHNELGTTLGQFGTFSAPSCILKLGSARAIRSFTIVYAALNVLIKCLNPSYEIIAKVESLEAFEKITPFQGINTFWKSINIKKSMILKMDQTVSSICRSLTYLVWLW